MANIRTTTNKAGLIMITVSLVAIVLITALLFQYLQKDRTTQIRGQVTTLMRALSGIPFDTLAPDADSPGLLRPVFLGHGDSAIAYAAISSPLGQPIFDVAAPGIAVPPFDANYDREGWLTEREIIAPQQFVEFVTPLYQSGQFAGFLRMGYQPPSWGLTTEQLPFVATLALVVFLLTPIFYTLLRREVRPLQEIDQQISTAMEQALPSTVEMVPNGEMSGFMERFSEFMDATRQRILELEGREEKLQASKRLITYSKARVENVLQSIPEAILILDQSGRVNYANRRIETLLNTTLEQVINEPPAEWCADEDLQALLQTHARKNAPSFVEDTIKLKTNAETGRTLSAKAYPLFSPADKNHIHGTMIILRDVTRQKLAQSSQADFVSHVAHELKTPLNTLSLYSEVLQGEGAVDESTRVDAANVIFDEVGRLSTLINNLLTITKIEQGEMTVQRQRVRLVELLNDAVDQLRRTDSANSLIINTEFPAEISSFSADKDLLRVAINNLLTNAVKYSDPGDTITISASETVSDIRLDVADTGIGISREDMPRVCQRFFRAEDEVVRSRTGHGLGLALVADIVGLHGGAIHVDSELGRGSVFSLTIPKESAVLKRAV